MVIGFLAHNPEMRFAPSGQAVTTFVIACVRSWNSQDGGNHHETEWFNVVTWGNLAEICKQCLFKDLQVYIEGRLQSRHWLDADGCEHNSVEIIASDMIVLEDRQEVNKQIHPPILEIKENYSK